MKTIHIKIHFPYNLWNGRKIKFYDGNNLVGSVFSESEGQIKVNEQTSQLLVKVDVYQSTITIPKNEKDTYLIIYKKLSNGGFLMHQFDSLNFKSLKGKAVSKEEYEAFNTSFYAKNQKWLESKKLNKSHLYIGLTTGIIVLLYSIFQETQWKDLLFLLAGGTIVSMLIILFEKGKFILGDYKLRIFATLLSIIFTLILIPNSDYPLKLIIGILAFLFYSGFLKEQKEVNKIFNA